MAAKPFASLGVILKAWRKQRHLTQDQLVDQISQHEGPLKTRNDISELERGLRAPSKEIEPFLFQILKPDAKETREYYKCIKDGLNEKRKIKANRSSQFTGEKRPVFTNLETASSDIEDRNNSLIDSNIYRLDFINFLIDEINNMECNNIILLASGPGTGKSFLLKYLYRFIQQHHTSLIPIKTTTTKRDFIGDVARKLSFHFATEVNNSAKSIEILLRNATVPTERKFILIIDTVCTNSLDEIHDIVEMISKYFITIIATQSSDFKTDNSLCTFIDLPTLNHNSHAEIITSYLNNLHVTFDESIINIIVDMSNGNINWTKFASCVFFGEYKTDDTPQTNQYTTLYTNGLIIKSFIETQQFNFAPIIVKGLCPSVRCDQHVVGDGFEVEADGE